MDPRTPLAATGTVTGATSTMTEPHVPRHTISTPSTSTGAPGAMTDPTSGLRAVPLQDLEPIISGPTTSVGSPAIPPDGGSVSDIAPRSSTLQAPSPRRTRLMDGIRKPKVYRDDTVWYGLFAPSGKPYNT
jgi:hypothetical protein